MTTPSAVSTRLAEASVPQVAVTASSSSSEEELNGLMANAEHRRRLEVQRVAMSNDSAGVAEAVEKLRMARDLCTDTANNGWVVIDPLQIRKDIGEALAALTGEKENLDA